MIMSIDPFLLAGAFGINTEDIHQPILPVDIRRKLHEIGWTEIHYSGLSKGSFCGYQLYLNILARQQDYQAIVGKRKISAFALVGSVAHLAFEDYENTCEVQADGSTVLGLDPWYWQQLFNIVIASNKATTIYTWDDCEVSPSLIEMWSQRLANRNTYGITLVEIFRKLKRPLIESGWEFVESEAVLNYVDGEGMDYPIVFRGTVDLIAAFRGMLFLFDLKSFGMWRILFACKGSPKSFSIGAEEMQYVRQLRHYDWLYWKINGRRVDNVGYILPSNMIPYKRSGKTYEKGADRGQPMASAPVLDMKQMLAYERDMVRQITAWTRNGFVRHYPEVYGKVYCVDCPFFDACLRDPRSAVTAKMDAYLEQYR